MTKDRIVKFCARVGPRSISLVTINCPQVGVVSVTWRINFLANKCKYLENGARQRYTYNGRLRRNRIYPIKWQQWQWPWMTLKVIHRSSNICAAFYTVSTDTVLVRFLCISWASCYHLSRNVIVKAFLNCFSASINTLDRLVKHVVHFADRWIIMTLYYIPALPPVRTVSLALHCIAFRWFVRYCVVLFTVMCMRHFDF